MRAQPTLLSASHADQWFESYTGSRLAHGHKTPPSDATHMALYRDHDRIQSLGLFETAELA